MCVCCFCTHRILSALESLTFWLCIKDRWYGVILKHGTHSILKIQLKLIICYNGVLNKML